MKVELISKTIGSDTYKDLDNEELVAAIARHGVIKNDNGKLVKYLMDNKHWSPLQHVSFGFKVETSRAISAQIFRHRGLNFQEFSQRYSKVSDYEPIEIRKASVDNRQSSTEVFNPLVDTTGQSSEYNIYADDMIEDLLEDVYNAYNRLLKAGVASECARMILPMASKTTIHITGTLRDLLAFLNVRLDTHSQLEIQLIAKEMAKLLKLELPNIFKQIDIDNGMFM